MTEVPNAQTGHIDDHLDEMTLLLYVEGQLERKRAQEVSAHTQDCPACRTLLRALERESRLLTRAMLEEDEPLPSRLAAFQERTQKSMQWIWGAVFALAATGAYALYAEYVKPMEERFEQAGFGGSNLLGLLIFQGAFWKGWQSMLTLLEVLAFLTIAASAVMFVRRRVRRGSVFAMIVAGICAAATLPSSALATEFRKGDNIEVAKDENIKGDIFMSGHRVKIEGTVDGDVYVFCQAADIEGHVTGDVIAFAQVVRITGHVDGNLRGFTNTSLISGTIAKNVLSFSEAITLDSSGKIGGSITTFVNSLTIDGNLGRDLLVLSKTTNISGTVGGAIDARGDSLTFGSGAQVDGPVKFKGNQPPDVSSRAKLAFAPTFSRMEHHTEYSQSHFYVWRVIWTAAVILFALVLFLLMPSFARETVDSAERYGASFGLGLLVLFGIPIAAIIACITVVGLLIGISTFVLWLVALFSAQIVVGSVVGQWLMGRTHETWQLIGRMVVGVIVIRVLGMIPYLGGWVRFAVVLWGMGAISLAIYKRLSPAAASPLAPAVPVAPSSLPPNTTIGTPLPV
jgi:cytoskeletal protein CcmA (bactofilin family)/predicted anti-sigma-YlaC factor YlaD